MKDKNTQEINFLLQQAQYFHSQNDLQKALEYYERAEKIARRHSLKGIVFGGLLNDKGAILLELGKFDNAVLALLESLEIKKKVATGETIAHTLMNLAGAYRANCEYEKALLTFTKVMNWAEKYKVDKYILEVKKQISYTLNAKNKAPLAQMSGFQLGTEGGLYQGFADFEYLPKVFNDLVAKVDYIRVESDLLETKISVSFSVSGKISESTTSP